MSSENTEPTAPVQRLVMPLEVMLLGGRYHGTSRVVDRNTLQRNGWRLYIPDSPSDRMVSVKYDEPCCSRGVWVYEARDTETALHFVCFEEEA